MISKGYEKAPFWKEYPDRDTENIRFYPLKVKDFTNVDLFRKKPMGLYVHIPFCKNICMSCPYHKIKPTNKKVTKYLEALKTEITNYANRPYIKNHVFTAAYFGGGTPTILSEEQLEDLLSHIHNSLTLSEDIEITFETTPVDITQSKLKILKKYGVDRISLGAQSFNDEELCQIGRNYTADKIIDVIKMIQDEGYKKLNIDVMYGMPGQTMESWLATIDKGISLEVSGISLYSFMLLDTTANVLRKMKNEVPPMADDIQRKEMFYKATNILSKAGYDGLFGDEFSKPGYKNAFVTKPWEECLEYLSVGAWAMGNIKNYWYFNETDMDKYIESVMNNKLPITIGSKIESKDHLRRKIILGMKTGAVKREDYRNCFGIDLNVLFADIINDLEKKDLVELTDSELRVNGPDGWYYLDNISKAFYEERFKRYPQPVQNDNVRYYK